MENVLLETELIKDYHKTDISPRCAMKIDISKAFDSVQWDFVLKILEVTEFPPAFIHWIRLCRLSPEYKSSFSMHVNGELARYFQSGRGLRQGFSLTISVCDLYESCITKTQESSGGSEISVSL